MKLILLEANEKIKVLGDLNAKVGERWVYGVTSLYGVPEVKENGKWLLELCVKKVMWLIAHSLKRGCVMSIHERGVIKKAC